MNDLLPIVTINYNGLKDTIALVKSLNLSNEKYHLFIVDNCSPKEDEYINLKRSLLDLGYEEFSEDNREMDDYSSVCSIRYPNKCCVSLIKSKTNGGFSKGTNIGIRYALNFYDNSKYMTILNNDTEVTEGFISKIIDVLDSKPEYAAGMGTILYYGYDKPYIWSIGGYPKWIIGQCVHELKNSVFDKNNYSAVRFVERGFVSGCFTVFKTEKLKEINLLDEDYFFAGEEYQYSVDLCKKYKLVWVPSSIIYHKSKLDFGNGSSHQIDKLEWQYAAYRTKCVFINKNKSVFFRFLWHVLFRIQILTKVKKRILGTVCDEKQYLSFKNELFKRINAKYFTAEEFTMFKLNIYN